MYGDRLKQAVREKMYGDGMGTDVMGMGTYGTGMGVMGMGCGWGETCGDGVSIGRTSCPRAAL